VTGAPSGEDWVEATGLRIAEVLRRAAAEADDGVARVALAGGNTPRPVYEWLASRGGVSWDRVEIYFGDERGVPPDHPESNYRMVMESLVAPAGVDPARVFRMEADREDLTAAAVDYARVLPDPVPVLLLGIGTDGHTASLFPGGRALAERERRVTAVPTEGSRRARLTVTPPVLSAAGRILVLARGETKAAPVARALQGPWEPRACPAQLVRHGVWLLDAAAAAGLEGSSADH
jgi:6-phosphogluconolactonase